MKQAKTIRTFQIQLNNGEISYHLVISPRAKRISLKISAEKGLEVIVPTRVRLSNLPRIIHEKEDWIIKNLTALKEKAKTKPKLTDGARLTIAGAPYIVRFLPARKKSQVKELRPLLFNSDTAHYGEPELRIYSNESESERKKVLEKFLREKARSHFTARTKEIAQQMGVTFNKISIKAQKTRWGSCSRKKNLNFNWRLILTTPEIIDALIIHELAHTVHLNHGKNFYALVAKHCPNHKALSKKLGTLQFII